MRAVPLYEAWVEVARRAGRVRVQSSEGGGVLIWALADFGGGRNGRQCDDESGRIVGETG